MSIPGGAKPDFLCTRRRGQCAFTLIESLVAAVVLALIVALAAQMTAATLSTVSQSTHTLDASESVRAATMMLRDELSSVVVSERSGRYLNLRVTANEERVVLFFAVPRAQTADLTRMGFVTHVAYAWDRSTRTLARAEYHSSRELDIVANTASVPDSSDMARNLQRLRILTPAYGGSQPYAWTESAWWDDRLKVARRNPLLTDVSEWKIECFESPKLDESSPLENDWKHSDRLPVVMRISFVVSSQRRRDTEKAAIGRRYVSVIPLPGAEVKR